MKQLINDIKSNLVLGIDLCLFRKIDVDKFIINLDQLIALICIELILGIIIDYFIKLPEPDFVTYALPTFCYSILTFILLNYALTRFWKRPEFFLRLCVIPLCTIIVFSVIDIIDSVLSSYQTQHINFYVYLSWVIFLYSYIIFSRIIYLASGCLKAFTVVTVISWLVLSCVEISLFGDYIDFWYQPVKAEEDSEEVDPWAEYREMDAETLMYQQRYILDANLKTLETGANNKSELFFLGFSGYATQDVFLKEITYAKELFDSRFSTLGHSINLINHLSTRETVPLANGTNLAITLKHIGSLMDTEQDILFLYLTSHGSKDHQLSVSFWPLRLNNLTPEKLNIMLDEAGIKWRIVIVSSCYSGGFIHALENEHTLVATAAAADKKSFGCSNENDFTYFGEALFKDRLSSEYSIISALEHVQTDIAEREAEEHLDASNPQLVIGELIQAKLDQFDQQLKIQQCRANSDESVTC